MSILMTACGGSSSGVNDEQQKVEAVETLNNFKEALIAEDESEIQKYIPEDGIKVESNLDDAPTDDNYINAVELNSNDLKLLFELTNTNYITNNEETIISGETFILSFFLNLLKAQMEMYAANNVNSQARLNQMVIDLEEIPQNMEEYYLENSNQNGYIFTENGRELITAISYDSSLGLTFSKLEDVFKKTYSGDYNTAEFKIENVKSNLQNPVPEKISGYEARLYEVEYDLTYEPFYIDLIIKNNKITTLVLNKCEKKEKSIVEKAYYANQDGNIHAVAYIGEQDKFDETKFDSVLDSFEITE